MPVVAHQSLEHNDMLIYLYFSYYFHLSNRLLGFDGLPIYILPLFNSLLVIVLAPIITLSEIQVPLVTKVLAPIHSLSPIRTLASDLMSRSSVLFHAYLYP